MAHKFVDNLFPLLFFPMNVMCVIFIKVLGVETLQKLEINEWLT